MSHVYGAHLVRIYFAGKVELLKFCVFMYRAGLDWAGLDCAVFCRTHYLTIRLVLTVHEF